MTFGPRGFSEQRRDRKARRRNGRGRSAEPSPGDAVSEAKKAADTGVKIFTVGVGTAQGSLIPVEGKGEAGFVKDAKGQVVKSKLDENRLREMAQATGRAETAGHTDQQAFHDVLSRRENRYLVRQLCWVLSIHGLETYILQPRDPADLDLLISAVQPQSSPWISAVIGVRGPVAPPEFCNGLMIPIVAFNQIYTFSRDGLIEAIPRPERLPAEQFGPAARELFDRIMQMTDNAGNEDQHRALNYLAVRYPKIYAHVAEAFAGDSSLSGVEVRPSRLSGTRNIVDCIFSYTNRNTDYTEKYFVRCDVTEEFPFLVTKLSPYYDR